MKILLTILSVSLLALAFLEAPASAQNIEKTLIRSENKDRACYTFVPEKVEAANPVPLVVLLHGSGRNGMSQAEKWKDLAKKEKFALAAPDSTNPSGWQIPQDGPDFIHTVVEYMTGKYAIDKRRVYIFGHSAGAIMALNLSLYESEYFAATVAHAGVLPKQMYPVIAEAKRKIPMTLIVGDLDNLFPVDAVRTTQKTLTEGGFKVEMTVLRNHTHDYYGISKDINDQAWTFLKAQKLAIDPVYATYQFK